MPGSSDEVGRRASVVVDAKVGCIGPSKGIACAVRSDESKGCEETVTVDASGPVVDTRDACRMWVVEVGTGGKICGGKESGGGVELDGDGLVADDGPSAGGIEVEIAGESVRKGKGELVGGELEPGVVFCLRKALREEVEGIV